MPRTILVFGASGYIGQHLVSELSQRGYTVRAVARRIERLQKRQLPGVTCYSVDLEKTTDVARLLNGVDTVYYLVHGMGESKDFIKHERRVAENVRDALLITPVKQLIFLSSLQAPEHEQSPHLRARQLTADILRSAGVPVSELRAGIIVGAGSAAFEVMRDMVYNLPVLTPPRWVRSRTTPIALENLLVYLVELLNHPSSEHRVFEAAGPEELTYQQQFEHFMAVSGRHRPLIPIPLPTGGRSHAAGADPAAVDPFRRSGAPHAGRGEKARQLQRLGLRRTGLCSLATRVRLFCQASRLYRADFREPLRPVAGRQSSGW